MIVYEAPHHLKAALDDLYETLGERRISICRELTKKFEEVRPTTLAEAISFYKDNEPRGEYVLVIEGKSLEEQEEEKRQSWQEMSIEDATQACIDFIRSELKRLDHDPVGDLV